MIVTRVSLDAKHMDMLSIVVIALITQSTFWFLANLLFFYWHVRLNMIVTRVNLDAKRMDMLSIVCDICNSDQKIWDVFSFIGK